MPINVFGNSNPHDNGKKIDTCFIIQKPHLRTKYIESNIEEDIDLKNQYRIKSLTDPSSTRQSGSKNYVDNLFNDLSIVKNSAHIVLNDRNITNARLIQSHLTAKLYVDTEIDQTSLLRLDANEKLDLDNQDSITLNSTLTDPMTIIEIPTKAYIDSLREENEQSRRDLGIDFNDESNDLLKDNQDKDLSDNKLTNSDSITINREPTSDNEVSNKKYIDSELEKNTILRFNQTLSNYLKESVGNDTNNLTKYNKISITEVTEYNFPFSGSDLLQKGKFY